MADDEDEASISISPIIITSYPRRENITGRAGEFVDEFIVNLKGEGVFNSMGVQCDKTFMLEGPPGVGKTLAMKVLNNEFNRDAYEAIIAGDEKRCADLVILPYNIGQQGTAYINRGSRKVQKFFDVAKAIADTGLDVCIELDECDSLLGNRGDSSNHGEDKKVLETIMKNLQDAHDHEGMYVVMMTNLKDACDPASLRAGRVDKIYRFELPTYEERIGGFQVAIDEVNNNAGYKVVRGYDLERLSSLTDKFSYADICESVRGAVKLRAREIVTSRTDKIIPAGYVTQKRLEAMVDEHKARVGGNKSKSKLGF